MLFTTGYPTQRGNPEEDVYELVIPNLEIRQIFVNQIQEWFQEEVLRNRSALDAFYNASLWVDAKTAEEMFNAYPSKTISIRDTSTKKTKKENFYHGILLGLLSYHEGWDICSNAESGNGYSDILIKVTNEDVL